MKSAIHQQNILKAIREETEVYVKQMTSWCNHRNKLQNDFEKEKRTNDMIIHVNNKRFKKQQDIEYKQLQQKQLDWNARLAEYKANFLLQMNRDKEWVNQNFETELQQLIGSSTVTAFKQPCSSSTDKRKRQRIDDE